MYIQEFLLMHKGKWWVLVVFLMFTGNFEAIQIPKYSTTGAHILWLTGFSDFKHCIDERTREGKTGSVDTVSFTLHHKCDLQCAEK